MTNNKWGIKSSKEGTIIYDIITNDNIIFDKDLDLQTARHIVEVHNRADVHNRAIEPCDTMVEPEPVYEDEGYIAGALFKEADQKQRIREKELLQEAIPSVNWFNPLTDNTANDKSKLPTASDVFWGDTERIINSRYIFAELDGEDAGVMMELGIAWGINYMLSQINSILTCLSSPYEVTKAIEQLLDEIPYKTIIAHLSDIRVGTAGKYVGHHIPFGINQYVVGGIEEIGQIYPSVKEAVEGLARIIEARKRELEKEGI